MALRGTKMEQPDEPCVSRESGLPTLDIRGDSRGINSSSLSTAQALQVPFQGPPTMAFPQELQTILIFLV